MISIALMGAGCGLAGGATILYLSGYFSSSTHSQGDLALATIIGLYPLTFVSVFFNVALAGAAAASFDGHPIGVREALGISWRRLGRIAQWSLLAAGVGLVLEQIASRIPGAGRLASWLLGAAWSLATIFAVPMLALEGAGPFETAKNSVHLIKSKWGEGITGLASIGIWTAFVTIPVGILIAVGLSVRNHDATVAAASDRTRLSSPQQLDVADLHLVAAFLVAGGANHGPLARVLIRKDPPERVFRRLVRSRGTFEIQTRF
jgi:hypothetical protein